MVLQPLLAQSMAAMLAAAVVEAVETVLERKGLAWLVEDPAG